MINENSLEIGREVCIAKKDTERDEGPKWYFVGKIPTNRLSTLYPCNVKKVLGFARLDRDRLECGLGLGVLLYHFEREHAEIIGDTIVVDPLYCHIDMLRTIQSPSYTCSFFGQTLEERKEEDRVARRYLNLIMKSQKRDN